jgi:hypothetical protein
MESDEADEELGENLSWHGSVMGRETKVKQGNEDEIEEIVVTRVSDYKVDDRPTLGVLLLSRKVASDKKVVAEGARFMRYAQGVYFFQPFSYPGERMIKACHTMMDDTLDRLTEHRLLRACDLFPDTTEVVYAQFLQGLAKTPYGIFIDHAWKSVVVAIRGTQSLDDVVADLTITPTSMEEWGTRCGFDGLDCFVHTGIFKCAEWIYNDLER